MSWKNQPDEIKPKYSPSQNTGPVLLAPCYMPTLAEIAATFRRSEETIKRWKDFGAPITYDGSGYGADYYDVKEWRKEFFKNKKPMG